MEENKDFDKDKQKTGTQQMPHVPTEGEEDGKKGTIVLFGHEFDKKKAVMAGLGGLLAIALIGGGVWYAASQKSEPKEPTHAADAARPNRGGGGWEERHHRALRP